MTNEPMNDARDVFALLAVPRRNGTWREELGRLVQAVVKTSAKPMTTTGVIRALGIDVTGEKKLADELNRRLHELKGPASPLHGYWRHSETRTVQWRGEDGERRASVEWVFQPEIAAQRRMASADGRVSYGPLVGLRIDDQGRVRAQVERSDGDSYSIMWTPQAVKLVGADDDDKAHAAAIMDQLEAFWLAN